jgi:excisionase family DNA binding protein
VSDSGELRLFTVEQVATLCQVSVKTVYRAIWQGRLRACRLGEGAAYRVRFEDIVAWLDLSASRTRSRDDTPRTASPTTGRRRRRGTKEAKSEGRLFIPEEMDTSS